MAEDQKKVELRIQISQKKYESPPLPPTPENTITEWHFGRIIGVVVALVVLVFVVLNLTTRPEPMTAVVNESEQKNMSPQATSEVAVLAKVKPTSEGVVKGQVKNQMPDTTSAADAAKSLTPEASMPTVAKAIVKPSMTPATSTNLPVGVLRSRLAVGMWENEPFGNVILPIKVNSHEATGLFYFTELENMQDQLVFHVWKRAGEIIFKQKKRIGSQRFSTYTSKLFTRASIGTWSVSVTDGDLKALHTIQFEVVAE